ncbi:uncharacterized protein [Haliotis asinina]|uniref:uncharacterized protein isoform X2 n=1 Tax=Haliotis asinina TaxID=109174 RepID=UPI0035318B7E
MALWKYLMVLSFLCTVRQVMSQFNSGCPQVDDCAQKVFTSLNSPDDVFICRSLVSYITCAQKAKRVCGEVDDSDIQQSVTNIYTAKNCTAVLTDVTTSVEMPAVTARNSVSAPTRGIHETGETSTQPEAASPATDTTSYILSTDRFKVTNVQNVDVTSTHLNDTNTPTMSFESTSRLEVTNTQNRDGTTTQRLKGTSTLPVASALTSRVKDTDTQSTERSTAPLMSSTYRPTQVSSSSDRHTQVSSSTDRHTQVSSSTALNRETITEVKTYAPQVTSSSTRHSSSTSEPAVVRRGRSSTLRVTVAPLSHKDDTTVPTSGIDMTTTGSKTTFKNNLGASLVTNTRTSRVTSPSILPGQPTDVTSGFHQSTKSADGTGSGTDIKKTSTPIPGELPITPPPEEEESTTDTSNPQGVGVPSSGTNGSLVVSTVSTVFVSWVCWTLYITTT